VHQSSETGKLTVRKIKAEVMDVTEDTEAVYSLHDFGS
jgi:hypothetical protein